MFLMMPGRRNSRKVLASLVSVKTFSTGIFNLFIFNFFLLCLLFSFILDVAWH